MTVSLPPSQRITLQQWTAQQLQGTDINTVCPRCTTDMVPGYVIGPKYGAPCCRTFERNPLLEYEDIDIIMVLKCPRCGKSEEIPQDIFTEPPVGFANWNMFWKSLIRNV